MRSIRLLPIVAVCGALSATAAAQEFARALERAERSDAITSIVIGDSQSLLAEAYFGGAGPHRAANVKSVSKSVLGALVGIALERGDLASIDTPIAEWFAAEYPRPFRDERKAAIRLEDLLTMRSGLETTSFYNYGPWVAKRDWVRGVLEQPVELPPGAAMRYSTGSSHLVSVILEQATGQLPRDYARRHLFGPLGLGDVGWDSDPAGHDFGGNNMSMTPRQMLRFGQLFLRNGEWNGEQIVPADWVQRSLRPRTRSPWNGYAYGYFWWTRRFRGFPVHYAWGHGGQRVFVIPDLDLVVVTTARLRANGRSGGRVNREIDEILEHDILRAAVDADDGARSRR